MLVACRCCIFGVVRLNVLDLQIYQEVKNVYPSRSELESSTIEGDSPVCESGLTLVGFLSTAGHANPVGSWGVHSPRLNTLDDR